MQSTTFNIIDMFVCSRLTKNFNNFDSVLFQMKETSSYTIQIYISDI